LNKHSRITSKLSLLIDKALDHLNNVYNDNDTYINPNGAYSLWLAYIQIEYAILVLKLRTGICNSYSITPELGRDYKSKKKIDSRVENDEDRDIKSVDIVKANLRNIQIRQRPQLLSELRLCRNLLKDMVARNSKNESTLTRTY
jgi:hypothetical protein